MRRNLKNCECKLEFLILFYRKYETKKTIFTYLIFSIKIYILKTHIFTLLENICSNYFHVLR